MREFIAMQMDAEFKANNNIREYLEKTYRLIFEQIDNTWQYFPKQDIPGEVEKRKVYNKGVEEPSDIEKVRKLEQEKPGMFAAKSSHVDPR